MLLSSIILIGCNSKQEQKTAVSDNIVEVKEEPVQASQSAEYKPGQQLPNELVCMVNDAYMAKPQIPVEVNGKTYYGCCNMCVSTLNEKESARLAVDPFTGQKVDKSDAFIVLLDQSGKVAYFESEETYGAFQKRK